jgi:hypothetical protein
MIAKVRRRAISGGRTGAFERLSSMEAAYSRGRVPAQSGRNPV